ncbi:uncharacterized protein LOC113272705 [Papaver somniferum]|uniref:uncharacterized protein LOC113272705 n=1 Tax=Papaver somniferum TaxID=3469 RepID=UPI000E6FFF84|nr:uncharacterized protein LOC113272705 [Papaver somniferum]
MPPRRDVNGPQPNGEEGEDRRERMEATLDRVVGTLGTLVQVVETQRQGRVDLEKFLKVVGRKEFKGTEEPLEAERWLMGIQKEFLALRVEENDKIRFSTYLFTGAADYWWDSIRRVRNVTVWAEFETLFFVKYFPETVKAQMCAEFATLAQGDMTVSQLDKKFSELERFGDNLVNTPLRRARKLQDALKPAIRAKLVPCRLTTYDEVLDTALAIEADWIKNQKEREPRDPKKNQKTDPSTHRKRPRTDNPGKVVAPKPCFHCGVVGHYARDCPKSKPPGQLNAISGCYRCGKDDHFVRECPLPALPRPPTQISFRMLQGRISKHDSHTSLPSKASIKCSWAAEPYCYC